MPPEKRKRRFHSISNELAKNSISAFISGIELYNKPNLNYRNETVLILIAHAWEIILKGILYKENNPEVKKYILDSLNEDDTNELIGLKKTTDLYCVGKNKMLLKEHLDMLRNLRNKVMHAYILPKELESVVWGLFQKSYELLNIVVLEEFPGFESEIEFPFILPIGIKQPITKNIYLSGLGKKEIPLINELYKSTENLMALGITETVIVPLTFGYNKKSKVSNADIIIAIDPFSEESINLKTGIELTHGAGKLQTPIEPDELRKIFTHKATEVRKKYKLHLSKEKAYRANIYNQICKDVNFQIYWWKDPKTAVKLFSDKGIQEIEKELKKYE